MQAGRLRSHLSMTNLTGMGIVPPLIMKLAMTISPTPALPPRERGQGLMELLMKQLAIPLSAMKHALSGWL